MNFRTTSTAYKRVDIYDSELGTEVLGTLQSMERNPVFRTVDEATRDLELYPSGIVPFVDKHMQYLHKHPLLNPEHYLANLRVKLKIR